MIQVKPNERNPGQVTRSPILGCAIGDALGVPFEVPNDAPLLHPKLEGWDGSYLSSRSVVRDDLEPGQWSDDTQMTVALARSLCRLEGGTSFSPTETAAAYAALRIEGIRGIGSTTCSALDRLCAGVPFGQSGIVGAEGNGSAMRVSPIGSYLRRLGDRLNIVAAIAREDAAITHRSIEAAEGSAAVATMVAALCNGTDRFLAYRAVLRVLHASTVSARLKLIGHLPWGDGLALALGAFGTRGHVTQTVPSAFACFLLTHSFENAVLAAVRAGGDTDTTAAITGALAGAYYGREGIPDRFVEGVEQADMLAELDASLARHGAVR